MDGNIQMIQWWETLQRAKVMGDIVGGDIAE